jgi:hypothetical protein
VSSAKRQVLVDVEVLEGLLKRMEKIESLLGSRNQKEPVGGR